MKEYCVNYNFCFGYLVTGVVYNEMEKGSVREDTIHFVSCIETKEVSVSRFTPSISR